MESTFCAVRIDRGASGDALAYYSIDERRLQGQTLGLPPTWARVLRGVCGAPDLAAARAAEIVRLLNLAREVEPLLRAFALSFADLPAAMEGDLKPEIRALLALARKQ